MMGYTAAEIGISCLGAICYGVLFALAALAVSVAVREAVFIPSLLRCAFVYEGSPWRLPAATHGALPLSGWVHQTASAATCILFTVGYIITSYATLDGALRLYTLVLSLVPAIFTYEILKSGVKRLSGRLIYAIFVVPILILRLLIYIPRRICLYLATKPKIFS